MVCKAQSSQVLFPSGKETAVSLDYPKQTPSPTAPHTNNPAAIRGPTTCPQSAYQSTAAKLSQLDRALDISRGLPARPLRDDLIPAPRRRRSPEQLQGRARPRPEQHAPEVARRPPLRVLRRRRQEQEAGLPERTPVSGFARDALRVEALVGYVRALAGGGAGGRCRQARRRHRRGAVAGVQPVDRQDHHGVRRACKPCCDSQEDKAKVPRRRRR